MEDKNLTSNSPVYSLNRLFRKFKNLPPPNADAAVKYALALGMLFSGIATVLALLTYRNSATVAVAMGLFAITAIVVVTIYAVHSVSLLIAIVVIGYVIVGDDNFRYLVGKTLNKENGVPFFDGLTVDGGYGNDEALEKKKAAAKSAESKKLATKSLEPEEPVAKKENGRRMLDGGPILAGGAIDSGAPGKKQLVVKSAEPKQPSPKTPKPTESEKPVAKMEVPNNK